MAYTLPYNRFFQANFSKAQLLIDFHVHGIRKNEYDEYIRQGIEDLIQNLSEYLVKYSVFLTNIDSVLNQIQVNDNDFTDICLIVLILISFILSQDRSFLSSEIKDLFTTEIEKLNDQEVDTYSYLKETYDWYLGYHRDLTTKYGCSNKELLPVPFICSSGAFGYNTFLCLYFHNIAPIGFATNLNPKLHVFISSIFEAADHDVRHYYRRYCKIPLDVGEQYKQIYYQITGGYTTDIEEGQLLRRKYLFFLFFLVNEISFREGSYKGLKERINLRFIAPPLEEDLGKYKLRYLIEVEDLIPVLVQDLKMVVENVDPYNIEDMNDYVRLCLIEILDLFQREFNLFT